MRDAALTLTRSTDDIDAELFRLYGLANRAPAVTEYREPLTAALRAQIVVLRRRMADSDAVERYEDDHQYVINAALNAAEWLYGDGAAPSAQWQGVIEDAA
jgi:hypothetical protein